MTHNKRFKCLLGFHCLHNTGKEDLRKAVDHGPNAPKTRHYEEICCHCPYVNWYDLDKLVVIL